METIELAGLWWLPENSAEKLAGNVKFFPDGQVKISLLGKFDSTIPSYNHLPILLGITANGSIYTLFDCFLYFGSSVNFSLEPQDMNFSRLEGGASHAFKGVHYKETESIKFSKLSLQVNNLKKWTGLYVSSDIEFSDSNSAKLVYQINILLPLKCHE